MRSQAGVRPQGQGINGQVWNILGQMYVPKHLTETSFSWQVTFPPGGGVTRHVHTKQDEFVFLLEGALDFVIDDSTVKAGPADLVFLPKMIPHSVHNHSNFDTKCLSWVSPANTLYEYFQMIDMMQDTTEMERLAALHDVIFV